VDGLAVSGHRQRRPGSTRRALADIPVGRRAIAVDGKTLRGSRTADTAADHVMAACDQAAGVVLASTDVDGKTNEITRFVPLLDQISDLRDTVITADAMHCQRDHVTYLAERGAHWILTVKGNQPHLHKQLTGLPWKAVPDATRDDDRGHGRREIRTLKILTVSTGIDFPHAAQAIQIRRRRRRLDEPKRFTTETVYAITDLHVHQAKPAQLAAWIRGHWSIENKIHWVRDVTYDEDRSQIRTGTGQQVMAVLPQHRDQPAPPGRRHLDRTSLTPKRPRSAPIPTTPRTHLNGHISTLRRP
jgi:predicted transposase YbfD/YdcC